MTSLHRLSLLDDNRTIQCIMFMVFLSAAEGHKTFRHKKIKEIMKQKNETSTY